MAGGETLNPSQGQRSMFGGQPPRWQALPDHKDVFDSSVVLELPGLVGGEAGEKRLALNLPPPDLEEDTLMEKDEAPEDVLEAAGGDVEIE